MRSKIAMEDLKALADEGLSPTPEDVVRLNALGLKLENSRSFCSSIYCLPRVAFLNPFVFRQPTLGHELWLDDVERHFDMSDPSTSLALNALACSVPDVDDLPSSA